MTPAAPGRLLPARAVPLPGEAFDSWATRQETLTGLSLVAWQPRRPMTHVTAGEINTLATVSGQAVDVLEAMTWHAYPERVVGHGPERNLRWLHDAPWTCPQCQPDRAMWKKHWEVGLCPCCLDCNVLLVNQATGGDVMPAPPTLVRIVTTLTRRLDITPRFKNPTVELRRIHRLCCLVAATIDDHWPARPASGLPVDYLHCRDWGGKPPADPMAVAEVLLAVVPLHQAGDSRALTGPGHQRLKELVPPDQRPSRAQLPKPYRPARYTQPPQPPRDEARPRTPSRIAYIATTAQRTITVNQIPALLPLPGDGFLPDPDQWAYRNDLAKALHMLLRVDDHGRPGQLVDAHNHFGEPNAAPSLLLRNLARGYLAPNASQDLDVALPLVAELPDLAARRALLHQHRTLPFGWNRIVPRGTDPALSHGWIWCYLTGGDLRGAPWWAKPDGWFPSRTVWDFHHSLDAHTLLAMAHAADDHINPTLDTGHTPAATTLQALA